MSMTDEQQEQLKTLKNKVKKIDVAMFTTIKPDGELVSRPMYSVKTDDSGSIWFFSNDTSGKITDLQHYENVNLAYSDPSQQIFVSISGEAEVVSNAITKDKMWNPIMQAWFPKGLNDPHLKMIKVTIHEAEYWDIDASKMVRLYEMGKAIVKGERYKNVENERINVDS